MNATYVAPAELNIYAAAQAGAEIVAALAGADDGQVLNIDLSQVGEIDAAGLQVLLSTALAGRRGACAVRFGAVPALVRERFAQFGLERLIEDEAKSAEAA
jgi:ABC-type transporter Mla MlaB component